MPNSKEYKKKVFVPTNNKQRVFSILSGQSDLPDNMYIGDICDNEHGIKGKSVRYKSNSNCIRCEIDTGERNSKRRKDFIKDNRDRTALDLYDAKQNEEEDWWGSEDE